MRELVDSLSLSSGALLVACASAVLAFAWVRIPRSSLRWIATVGVPILLSYVVLPVDASLARVRSSGILCLGVALPRLLVLSRGLTVSSNRVYRGAANPQVSSGVDGRYRP